MNTINYEQFIAIARKWGEIIAEKAGHVTDIGTKKQWLTEQDIAIEQEFSLQISTLSGDHRIFGEELHDDFHNAENIWVIDPISGTYNYLHGLPHFAIVLSHVIKGEVVFGMVYDPILKEMFTAEKGKGAFLNGASIHVAGRKSDLSIMFDPHPEADWTLENTSEAYKRLYSLGRIKTFGSFGLHYAYVACGRADIAVTLNKDTFPEYAGKLILSEAGGILTAIDGSELKPQSHGIVAADLVHHDAVKELFKGFPCK